MKCKKCGGEGWIYLNRNMDSGSVYRRRRCKQCGEKWTTIELPSVSLKKWHDAQILDSAFTLTGTGCYVNGCNYTATADLSTATVDGTIVAHDIQNGRVEVAVSIVQSGSTEPTVTAGTGWEIVSPLTVDNPDSDFPTWTATLRKNLTSVHPSAT